MGGRLAVVVPRLVNWKVSTRSRTWAAHSHVTTHLPDTNGLRFSPVHDS
jgi:hypothetical protein